MAMRSAMYMVEHDGPVSLRQVIGGTGLVEIRAKKALEDLVREGKVFKVGFMYYSKRMVPSG